MDSPFAAPRQSSADRHFRRCYALRQQRRYDVIGRDFSRSCTVFTVIPSVSIRLRAGVALFRASQRPDALVEQMLQERVPVSKDRIHKSGR
jgi:hypothetical protein